MAEMGVGYKAIRERFTTASPSIPQNLRIVAEYIDGPFRHLENRWAFKEAEGGGCTVDFFITYEFKSRTLGHAHGHDVRPRLPQVHRRLRGTGEPGLRRGLIRAEIHDHAATTPPA